MTPGQHTRKCWRTSAITRMRMFRCTELRRPRGDVAEMRRQVAWANGKVGIEDILLAQQADTEAFYGRLGEAREFSRRAIESAHRAGKKEARDVANERVLARSGVRQLAGGPARRSAGPGRCLNPRRADYGRADIGPTW